MTKQDEKREAIIAIHRRIIGKTPQMQAIFDLIRRVAPSDSNSSTRARFDVNCSLNRSSPKEIPLSVLPSTMPNSGIAYWGWYQGWSPRTTTKRANEVINHVVTQIDTTVSSHMPG